MVLRVLFAAVAAAGAVHSLTASTVVELQGTAVELQTETAPGSAVTMRLVSTSATGDQFQWLFNDQPLARATAASLELNGLTSAQSGNYRLRRVTAQGRIELSNTLTLNVAPARPSMIDLSFRAQLPANANNAWAVWQADDGDVLVAISVGNDTHIARLNGDGSLDRELALPFSDGSVLTAFPDGGLLVSQPPYRRDAHGNAQAFALPAGFDTATPLRRAVVLADGRFLIAQSGKLARMNHDGSLDSTFNFDPDVPLDLIADLLPDAAGRVLVNGISYLAGGGDSTETVFRILPTGRVDPSFAKMTAGYRERIDVYSLPEGYLTRWSGFENMSPVLRVIDDAGNVRTGVALSPLVTVLAVDGLERIYLSPPPAYRTARYTLTSAGLQQDPTFEAADEPWGPLFAFPDGQLYVVRGSRDSDGFDSPLVVRIRSTTMPGFPPTAIISAPSASDLRSIQKGQSVTLTSIASSAEPLTYQWLALDGQPLPGGATSPSLALPNFSAANLARYQLRVTNAVGSALSNVVELSLPTAPSLMNLSGRAMSGTGDDTVIAGFVTSSPDISETTLTLIRGVGPSLEPFGIKEFLPDPAIQLFDTAGHSVATNENWGNDTLELDFESNVGAFPLAANSRDAALLQSISSARATVHLLPRDGRAGVGLLEIYQAADPYHPPTLVNLSLRAKTGPGEATAIAGFVIVDPQHFDRPARVLLRAVGPALTSYGIAHPLANPVLTVFNNKGQVIAQNDDWSATSPSVDSAALVSAMKQVGAFDLGFGSKDAALLLDLSPGAYTMHSTGGEGIVLMEIYLVR
jgi:hypothetical protein